MFITSEVDRLARAPLHAAVISCCVLPVAQRKDLVAKVRRSVFAASGFCSRRARTALELGSHLTRRWREMDSNHRSPARKSRFLVAESELRDRTGAAKKVVSYAVPMVRIHLFPARSLLGT